VKPAVFISLAVLAITACNRVQPAKPVRYIINSGTAGWVRITYNRSDAPQLPVEDGFAVVRIPQDMSFATRSRMNPSWDGSEFYYQGPDGKRQRLSSKDDAQRRLWGLEKTSDDKGDREVFFVGKPEQFTQVFKAAGDMGSGNVESTRPDPKKEAESELDLRKIQTDLPK
jgi:hypothetical protein